MASYVPPVKNGANGWVGYISLAPRTATGTWQANPTLASGDVKIAIDDGAPANLGTLPVVDADFTKRVKIVLSQAETNGDNLSIIFSDASGAEWCDLTINLQTVARQIDDLAFPVTSGRGIDVDASGGVEVGSFQANAITATAFNADAITAAKVAADVGTEIGTAVWATTTRILTALDEDTTTLDLDATIRAAVGLASANLDTQLDALPTNAELATALGTADDAVLAAIAALNNLSQANIRTAVGLGSANLDTQLDALPTNAELATALGTADDAVLAAIAALNNLSQANIRTAVGLGSANLDTQIADLPTNAELATALLGPLPANVKQVNSIAVDGSGTAGDPWGPV